MSVSSALDRIGDCPVCKGILTPETIRREKRHAQQRVVQMILPENFVDVVPEISLEGARNDAE
jgi:hypothetical protein